MTETVKLAITVAGVQAARQRHDGNIVYHAHPSGPRDARGRTAVVVLARRELAELLGAIPALDIADDEDFRAFARVMRFLGRGEDAARGT